MDDQDVDLLRAALASPSETLRTAGLFPSVEQLATFVHADPAGAWQLLCSLSSCAGRSCCAREAGGSMWGWPGFFSSPGA